MPYSRYRNTLTKALNDPYREVKLIEGKFNYNVPVIKVEPKLSDYGLPSNVQKLIDAEHLTIEKKAKAILTSIYVIGFLIALDYFISTGRTFSESFLTAVGTYGWVSILIFELFLSGWVEGKKKTAKLSTPLGMKYAKYKRDYDAYTYWNRVSTLDYWMNLSGHQFEDAVAAVFRNAGYSTQVSKQGGDGGVDIILTKDNKITAVQCKAHKAQIGPSVARDFYGTLIHNHYSQGILVSRSGFTSGVYEFVRGKPIELLNLENLLKVTNK